MTESQVDGLKKYNFGVLGSKCHTLYKLVDLWCILLLIEILEGTPSISELVVVYYIIVLI